MPIINLGSSFDYSNGARTPRTEFHPGEYCPLPGVSGMNDQRQGDTLYTTHHGLCVAERERNMYDDSDFFMTVWDPVSRSAHEIMFATTRGWSYPCMASSVDATPEVQAEYKAYLAYRQRRNQVLQRRSQRQQDADTARKAGLTRQQVQRLRDAVGLGFWTQVSKLITSNLRSGFRKSLRQQIIDWAQDPAPRFQRPLSLRQMQYV